MSTVCFVLVSFLPRPVSGPSSLVSTLATVAVLSAERLGFIVIVFFLAFALAAALAVLAFPRVFAAVVGGCSSSLATFTSCDHVIPVSAVVFCAPDGLAMPSASQVRIRMQNLLTQKDQCPDHCALVMVLV